MIIISILKMKLYLKESVMKKYFILFTLLLLFTPLPSHAKTEITVATFNVALNRKNADDLTQDLLKGNVEQIQKIAAIIQHTNPDIILLNEFDGQNDTNVELFIQNYLVKSQFGEQPIHFPYYYRQTVNTGLLANKDISQDGKISSPQDCYGFGFFPGQYGMVILSKFPIQIDQARSFQKFLWKDVPNAMLPKNPETGENWYNEKTLSVFRLSSKSHWDVPITLPSGKTVHILASHPTPPVFDGPEDRNGTRNHDEIRFWADYVAGAKYPYDDNGTQGGLESGESFVILGDLNADPQDGDSTQNPVMMLLEHELVLNRDSFPGSIGGEIAAIRDGKANTSHRGNPVFDTSDFPEPPGNLKVDYVLPSINFELVDQGVFWPAKTLTGTDWIDASDHRLVWVKIKFKE